MTETVWLAIIAGAFAMIQGFMTRAQLKKLDEVKEVQKEGTVIVSNTLEAQFEALKQQVDRNTAALAAAAKDAHDRGSVVADKLDEQTRVAEQNAALVTSSAKEAAQAAGKAAVTTETIHALVNERLSKEIKDKEEVMAANGQLLAMNAQLMAVLAKAGAKINGGHDPDPKKPGGLGHA